MVISLFIRDAISEGREKEEQGDNKKKREGNKNSSRCGSN